MLHHHFQRIVVFGAAILFLAYAMATDDRQTKPKTEPDDDSSDATDGEDGPTVVDVASQAGRFGTWSLAVRQAGLVSDLEGSGPFTLFAPTDDSFADLKERLDELLADERRLAAILRRHIVPGRYASSDLSSGLELKTLAETTLVVKVTETELMVGDSTVVERDLTAGNGVIHGIDKVMLPQAGNAEEDETA